MHVLSLPVAPMSIMLSPFQAGDVPVTYADSEALERDYGFRPEIGIREGLRRIAEWYAE